MENTDLILDAPQVEKMQLQFAGFWIRVAAYVIDTIIMWVVLFVLALLFTDPEMAPFVTILNLFAAILYFALMESSVYQGTIGKMAVGIKVGDKNGDQISVLNAIGRYFAKMISALMLCIGFMMVGWDDKKQGLHDRLADTYVFYK